MIKIIDRNFSISPDRVLRNSRSLGNAMTIAPLESSLAYIYSRQSEKYQLELLPTTMNYRRTFNDTDDQRQDPMLRSDMWDKMAARKSQAAETAKYGNGPWVGYAMTYDEYMAKQHLYPHVSIELNYDRSGNCIQSFRDVSSSPHGPIICQRRLEPDPHIYTPRFK